MVVTRLHKCLVLIIAISFMVAIWSVIRHRRTVDYTGREMNAIAVALAAYMELTGGQMPDSVDSLLASGIATGEPNGVIAVTCTSPEDFGWCMSMVRDAIDLRSFVILWGEDARSPSGLLVASKRFPELLRPASLGINRALQDWARRMKRRKTDHKTEFEGQEKGSHSR